MSESGPSTAARLPPWLTGRPVPVLILLCLLAWLPGVLSLPPLDRDESRFAQASRQMIESGDYVDIRFSTVPRYNKPVGIYWAQAAAARLFGHPPYNQIWTYRLPSLLGGILAVLLTYWSACAFAPPETAFLGAALLTLTVALSVEAEIATTDALLLATIVAAQGFLLRLYLHARGQLAKAPALAMALAAWGAVGVGILLKGPVILVVLGLTMLALSLWDRDWRWLRGFHLARGIVVLLLIVLPWAIAIAFASHGAFYQRSLGHDFAAKIMGGQESHGAPPGYYLALASITLWPTILFALPGLGFANAHRTQPVVRFLLAWLVPSWLMFELVPTKLPHYILPVYPALALMAAVWLANREISASTRRGRILEIIAAVLFLIVAVATAVGSGVAEVRFGQGLSAMSLIATAPVVVLAIAAVLLTFWQRRTPAAICALAAALVLYPLLSAGVAPGLDRLWISRSIAEHLAHDRTPTDPPPVLAGYVEPSAVFLLGTNTLLESGKTAGGISARQGGLALIEDQQRGPFLESLHAAGGTESVIDEVSGFDYSRGRDEHVTFYRVTPAPAETMPPPE